MNTPHKPLNHIRSLWSPFVIIVITAIISLGISIYCLSSGYFIIFQNLLYIPMILACVYYTKRGFALSVVIACIYLILTTAFTRDAPIILQACIRVVIFILVAGIITYLSSARKRADKKLYQQQDHLENMVHERTAKLEENANNLEQAQKAILLGSHCMQILLRLNQMTEATQREIADYALEEAVRLTESKMGYLAFLKEDESVLAMHAWSKSAVTECAVDGKPMIYPVVYAGLWGEAVRQRRPVISNDYAAANPLKKGHPEGRVTVNRHVNVPVFEGSRIVMVAGVGNKTEEYDKNDVQQLTLLMEGMWRMLERNRTNEMLRESEQKLSEIVAENSIPTIVIDKDHLITHWNKACQNLTGLPKEQLLNTNHQWKAFYPQERPILADLLVDSAPESEIVKRYGAKSRKSRLLPGVYEGEDYFPSLGEQGRWLFFTAAPIRNIKGEISGAIETLQDVTERKRSEEELQEHRMHLEKMIEKRTTDLVIAKERAESADRIKSAFLATMSHELRTPLNSIIGFTGMIIEGLAGPLTDEQSKQLGMVQNSSYHLLALINDVLDISKIEAGQLEVTLKRYDFRKSIHKVISSSQPLAEHKGLELRTNISPDVIDIVSDARRVEQILLNLLSNAIKFTEKGSISIECNIADKTLVTSITDTGIGIRDEDFEKLFKPFSQIDTGTTRAYEGTGLGLSICKKLVEKLGGTITGRSQIGTGSTFSVALPIIEG